MTKKRLLLFSILLLSLFITACSKPKDELTGTWKLEVYDASIYLKITDDNFIIEGIPDDSDEVIRMISGTVNREETMLTVEEDLEADDTYAPRGFLEEDLWEETLPYVLEDENTLRVTFDEDDKVFWREIDEG